MVKVFPVEPAEVDHPYAKSLVVVGKTTEKTDGATEASERYYLSSLDCYEHKAGELANLVRGHWAGCEIRNHWVRDHLMREDDTRSKNWFVNSNLALVRTALLHEKGRLLPDEKWKLTIERAQADISFCYQFVTNHNAK
jgi:predicted transposase YbfD/YdcC